MRIAINSAIINNNKEILLVKKRDTWILPGGKPDEGESDLECLNREISEELNGAKLRNTQFYNIFVGQTPYKGDQLEARVYFAELITDILSASAELSEAKFIKDFDNYKISDITLKILNGLKITGNL
ncbi:MAG: NUDIX domain-containing protein [Candidatus Gracilibacteria bacterium]|nr:NUDIX domain-containing protein [Candidatus Gracilibacteria bacterium]